jgi:hypothetical protein
MQSSAQKCKIGEQPRIKQGSERLAVTILNLQEYPKYRPIHTYSQSKRKSQYLAKQVRQSQTPLKHLSVLNRTAGHRESVSNKKPPARPLLFILHSKRAPHTPTLIIKVPFKAKMYCIFIGCCKCLRF